MRTESEIYSLILKIANDDEHILAVYMNGSRTDEKAEKDIFQDYDIVYVVDETKRFYGDDEFINKFGNILYMQSPDALDLSLGKDVDTESSYGWLMQFDDGVRIDLHVQSAEYAKQAIKQDELCKILLDKHSVIPPIHDSNDSQYHVKAPKQCEFDFVCNEFYWCMNNVAKGIWRDETPYVMEQLNFIIRPQLIKMLSWKIGYENNFSVSVGKSAKRFSKFLSHDTYNKFLQTYPAADKEQMITAAKMMFELFEESAKETAQNFHFVFDEKQAENSFKFFIHAVKLPKGATEIY